MDEILVRFAIQSIETKKTLRKKEPKKKKKMNKTCQSPKKRTQKKYVIECDRLDHITT